METFRIAVDGMTCGHCTSTVERALKANPGVLSVTVSLDEAHARVEATPGSLTAADLVDCVEMVGFDARALAEDDAGVDTAAAADGAADIEHATLRVDGMTCGHCTGTVERALKASAGVLTVAVSLDEARARVMFSRGATSAAELAETVELVGFDAAVLPPEEGAAAAAAAAPADGAMRSGEPVKLLVEPMVCARCVGWVRDALHTVGGVARVDVSLAEQTAHVFAASGGAAAPAPPKLEALLDAARAAGYRAEVCRTREDAHDSSG